MPRAKKPETVHIRGDLRKTLAWLAQIRGMPGNERVLVGLSGGKDSLVTLDLCAKVWGHTPQNDRVVAYSMHFLPGLECHDVPVDRAGRRFGVRVIKVMDYMTSNLIRLGVYRNHIREAIVGDKRLPKAGLKDVFAAVRKESGIRLIASGERMDDSLHRRGQLHKCSGYEEKTGRVFPIWDWSQLDVFGYLRSRHIPIPVGVGKFSMNGVGLRLETLKFLRENWPLDYQKILEVFPYADAQLAREEFLAKRRPEEQTVDHEPGEGSGDE